MDVMISTSQNKTLLTSHQQLYLQTSIGILYDFKPDPNELSFSTTFTDFLTRNGNVSMRPLSGKMNNYTSKCVFIYIIFIYLFGVYKAKLWNIYVLHNPNRTTSFIQSQEEKISRKEKLQK